MDFGHSLLFEIFAGLSLTAKKANACGQNKYIKERDEFLNLKEISKEGIRKLIKNGFIKLSSNGGYVNPKRNQAVGVIKTVHGRHYYIEDWYADTADRLR